MSVLSEHAQSWCQDNDGDACCLLIARLAQSLLPFCEVHSHIHSMEHFVYVLLNSVYLLQSADYCWLCFPLFCWKEMHTLSFQNKLVKCSGKVMRILVLQCACVPQRVCVWLSHFVYSSGFLYTARLRLWLLQILCKNTMTQKKWCQLWTTSFTNIKQCVRYKSTSKPYTVCKAM